MFSTRLPLVERYKFRHPVKAESPGAVHPVHRAR